MHSPTRWIGPLVLGVTFMAGIAAAVAQSFESGPWRGDIYVNQNGRFERCVATADYPNNPTLGFGVSAGGTFEVWLINQAWALEPGAPVQVTLQVDSAEPRTGTFQAASPDAMGGRFPNARAFMEQLKKGNALAVKAPQGTFSFQLVGTFKAIDKVLACAMGTELLALSPRNFAGVVLTHKEGTFKIVDATEEELRRVKAELIWNVPGGVGLATGLTGSSDMAKIREALVKGKQPKCPSTLQSSATSVPVRGAEFDVQQIEIHCPDVGDGSSVVEIFSFFPVRAEQAIVISHAAKTRDQASAADQEFRRRVESILNWR